MNTALRAALALIGSAVEGVTALMFAAAGFGPVNRVHWGSRAPFGGAPAMREHSGRESF